jgi:putative component of toxin-antitoxin plasmid stabilization module
MDTLDDVKFAALSAAIELVLVPNGLSLIGTPWLKHVEKGIFEFRIKYSAADIKAMYANLEVDSPMPPAKILIRLFIHFHGSKIILLLNGYDKARDDKHKKQQMEIKLARVRLQRWRADQK